MQDPGLAGCIARVCHPLHFMYEPLVSLRHHETPFACLFQRFALSERITVTALSERLTVTALSERITERHDGI